LFTLSLRPVAFGVAHTNRRCPARDRDYLRVEVAIDAAAQIVRDAILPAIPDRKLGRSTVGSNDADMHAAMPIAASSAPPTDTKSRGSERVVETSMPSHPIPSTVDRRSQNITVTCYCNREV
jgi:hypothetical protein